MKKQNNNREIEQKFRLKNTVLLDVYDNLVSLNTTNISRAVDSCTTTDTYFKPNKTSVNIIRLRDSMGIGSDGFTHSLKEITFKAKDKGHNNDRIEENIKILESGPAYRGLVLSFGEPVLTLFKTEKIIWTKGGLIVSLARVSNDGVWDDDVFLEVEGSTAAAVTKYVSKLQKTFTMVAEPKSFYELFK